MTVECAALMILSGVSNITHSQSGNIKPIYIDFLPIIGCSVRDDFIVHPKFNLVFIVFLSIPVKSDHCCKVIFLPSYSIKVFLR